MRKVTASIDAFRIPLKDSYTRSLSKFGTHHHVHKYIFPAQARRPRMPAIDLLHDTWECDIYTASDESCLRTVLQLKQLVDKKECLQSTKLASTKCLTHLAELLRSLLRSLLDSTDPYRHVKYLNTCLSLRQCWCKGADLFSYFRICLALQVPMPSRRHTISRISGARRSDCTGLRARSLQWLSMLQTTDIALHPSYGTCSNKGRYTDVLERISSARPSLDGSVNVVVI